MKLAILSDTHGLLRPEVAEYLKTSDAILHGGGVSRQAIVDELRQYAPLYIVRAAMTRTGQRLSPTISHFPWAA